jgi:aspartate kinase
MSFAEASELAFYGAKVLHRRPWSPPVRKNIPIRVAQQLPARVRGDDHFVACLAGAERHVKSIASKDKITVGQHHAPPMIFQYRIPRAVASIFAKHQAVIDMVATSEVCPWQ